MEAKAMRQRAGTHTPSTAFIVASHSSPLLRIIPLLSFCQAFWTRQQRQITFPKEGSAQAKARCHEEICRFRCSVNRGMYGEVEGEGRSHDSRVC
jgi:hypothetical protein